MSTPTLERPQIEAAPPGASRKPLVIRNPQSQIRNRAIWAAVPLLAIVAYVMVLRVGFLADDFILLEGARNATVTPQSFLPEPTWFFYRPIGVLLTWTISYALWGFNPLPYHIVGLLLHAATSLFFALWLRVASGRRSLGILAGALFAVYPLHMEAVGWLSAQWDGWAAMFCLLSLLLFTLWWKRQGRWKLYMLSFLFFFLSIFTKESVLAFLPVFAISAWFTRPTKMLTWERGRGTFLKPFRSSPLGKLFVSLVPFGGVVILNVAMRFATWGTIGSYQSIDIARGDYQNIFWQGLSTHLRLIVSPINSTVLGSFASQAVSALASVLIFVGLVLYGRRQWRLLLLALAWLLFALLPVINLPPRIDTLEGNRFYYLPTAGYCLMLVAFIQAGVAAARRWKQVALALVGLLLVAGVAVSWVQLRPWHTATVQAVDLEQQLIRFIPPQPRPQGMVWYVESTSFSYEGAYILRGALGKMRYYLVNDEPVFERAADATQAPLSTDARDAFSLRFTFDPASTRYNASFVKGITSGNELPTIAYDSMGLITWDFRNCDAAVLGKWQVAASICKQGAGITISPGRDSSSLTLRNISLDPSSTGALFLRLRVSVTHPGDISGDDLAQSWQWKGENTDWVGNTQRDLLLKRDGQPHVYWTFIPTSEIGSSLTDLRFQPANGSVSSTIQWIALDMVK